MPIKYVDCVIQGDGQFPKKKYPGDAGYDLAVSRGTIIKPGETVDVHTDVYFNMPCAVYGRITGRSSTMRKHHLMVNEGIIDNSFTGEMYISVTNLGRVDFVVTMGMRLAQIIFHKVEDVRIAQVEEIPHKPGGRNDKGFGSTGEGEWK